MFFGMCIYETLDGEGKLESIIVTPSKDSPSLITDRLSDIGPNLSRDVDIGPLRFYTDECGLSVRTAASRLAPRAFRQGKRTIEFEIEHRHWPLPESHAGYYILLLPAGYGGSVQSTAQNPELIFMPDTHQLLFAATVYPGRSSIAVNGRLELKAPPPPDAATRTTTDVFRSTLPGVHYRPVDNLLKALRQDLKNSPTAFLCHSSSDKEKVRRLAIELATRGVRPWIDEAEIRTGDSLIQKIQTGIKSTTCLVPVLSKAAVASRWCQEELRMALVMQIKSGIKGVMPVLTEDCDIPGFLLEKAYADLRDWKTYDDIVTRLAADIRELDASA